MAKTTPIKTPERPPARTTITEATGQVDPRSATSAENADEIKLVVGGTDAEPNPVPNDQATLEGAQAEFDERDEAADIPNPDPQNPDELIVPPGPGATQAASNLTQNSSVPVADAEPVRNDYKPKPEVAGNALKDEIRSKADMVREGDPRYTPSSSIGEETPVEKEVPHFSGKPIRQKADLEGYNGNRDTLPEHRDR